MQIYAKFMQLHALYDDICNPKICQNMQKYAWTPRISILKNKYAKFCENLRKI